MNFIIDEDEVILYDICKAGQYCSIGVKNVMQKVIMGNQIKGECRNIESTEFPKAYLGEKCKEDKDCLFNNICNGTCIKRSHSLYNSILYRKLEETCNSSEDCYAGYYCDSKENICKKQKGENEACSNYYECKNNLLCYNNICGDYYFSFDNKKNLSLITGKIDIKYFCQFGQEKDGKCFKYKSLKNTDQMSNFISPVECKLGEKCKYISEYDGTTYELPCSCGYNTALFLPQDRCADCSGITYCSVVLA